MLKEGRFLIDLLTMLPALMRASRAGQVRADFSPVMVLPGFGGSDRTMAPLRRFLSLQGVQAEGWGLGTNRAGLVLPHTLAQISSGWNLPTKTPYRREGGVALLCDLVVHKVASRAAQIGRPMTLIGWSLGGTIAREVARDLPDAVNHVITLGSPVTGGPKYTAAARTLRRQGLDLDWIEEQVRNRDRRPIQQAITSLVSRSDGIVGWSAAIDRISPNVRHIEMPTSHVGMAFNAAVWRQIMASLAEKASLA